jgi:hypothetical protein
VITYSDFVEVASRRRRPRTRGVEYRIGSTMLLLPSLAIDARTAARGLDILARSI